MWRKYFKLVKLVPGKVVVPKFGVVDFRRDNLSVDLCKTLFENDFDKAKENIARLGNDYERILIWELDQDEEPKSWQ